MPEKDTVRKAKEDLREGKSPTTAAGEFVHEGIQHVREGKHGARSPQQAIAIGLSKARRAGIPLKPPAKSSTRKSAEHDYRRGQTGSKKTSHKRSQAREKALKREPRSSASHKALSRHAHKAARRQRSRG